MIYLILILLALGLPVPGLAEEGRPKRPPVPSVVLETATGSLSDVRGTTFLLLTTADRGGEVLTYDLATGELRRFNENGAAWGEPLELRDENNAVPQPILEFASRDGDVALIGGEGIYLFGPDGALEGHRRIFMPGGIAATQRGWALSLVDLPHPVHRGEYLARKEFGDEVPRVILLDDDLEILEKGLLADDPSVSTSAAAGRQLHLAGAADRLYAIEKANYRLFELDKRLDLRGTFRDPELTFESGRATEGREEDSEGDQNALVASAKAEIERRGQNVGGSASPPRAETADPVSASFDYVSVVEAAVWDESSKKLILLLASDVLDRDPMLDLLDPATGKVSRVRVRMPPGVRSEGALNQLAIGRRYLWIRARRGNQPTFRLRLSSLAETGLEIELPEHPSRAEESIKAAGAAQN